MSKVVVLLFVALSVLCSVSFADSYSISLLTSEIAPGKTESLVNHREYDCEKQCEDTCKSDDCSESHMNYTFSNCADNRLLVDPSEDSAEYVVIFKDGDEEKEISQTGHLKYDFVNTGIHVGDDVVKIKNTGSKKMKFTAVLTYDNAPDASCKFRETCVIPCESASFLSVSLAAFALSAMLFLL